MLHDSRYRRIVEEPSGPSRIFKRKAPEMLVPATEFSYPRQDNAHNPNGECQKAITLADGTLMGNPTGAPSANAGAARTPMTSIDGEDRLGPVGNDSTGEEQAAAMRCGAGTVLACTT
jgi:hypothetical protein